MTIDVRAIKSIITTFCVILKDMSKNIGMNELLNGIYETLQ